MRWVHVAVALTLGAALAACPRGPTAPAAPEPAPPPDASVFIDAPVEPDAPLVIDGPALAAVDAPPAPTAADEARFAACADACTMYAVCYEIVYGEDYYKGESCMDECAAMTEPDRADFSRAARVIEDLRGRRRKRACAKLIGE